MAYYLRKENKKKGTYLQMYESHWDKEKKQPRSKSVMTFGYVHELISDEIPDPVSYYTHFVAEKNKERAAAFTEETRPRAFAAPVEYNLGYMRKVNNFCQTTILCKSIIHTSKCRNII